MQKLKYHLVEEKLASLNLKIFTALDLSQLFGASKRASEAFLSYNTQKGLLIRLRKGFYAFPRNLPHDFLIANQIYSPSYVSLETALSFYGLIPEIIYPVVSITTKKTSSFLINNREFVYHKIKPPAFTGYELVSVGKDKAYLAIPEKAVADFVYFVFLNIKSWYDRFDFGKVNGKKVEDYLKLFNKESLIDFWRELRNRRKND